ncbi:hypothetical protein D3C73_1048960 [compost metagenome]
MLDPGSALFHVLHETKVKVTVFRCEIQSLARRSRANHYRATGLVIRLRFHHGVFGLMEVAIVVDTIALPESRHDVHPLVSVFITLIVLHHFTAKHFHFRRKPSGDQVEAETPLGNMVNRGRHFCGNDRMNGRYVSGGEKLQFGGHCGHGGCPCECFHVTAVEVCLPTKSTPASDGHHTLPACRLKLLGDFDVVFKCGLKR